ncbi:hypothetical protein EVAR_68921_1 [Eumeta japonica]|uniref:Uncharacterized protein n=1 Tax=Eumeta variegata TaxID=151549 RepID=A0A4C2ADW2_EUMVA|nr:hypothetical protein EVAR_68921_1 [Eumeta japonica]
MPCPMVDWRLGAAVQSSERDQLEGPNLNLLNRSGVRLFLDLLHPVNDAGTGMSLGLGPELLEENTVLAGPLCRLSVRRSSAICAAEVRTSNGTYHGDTMAVEASYQFASLLPTADEMQARNREKMAGVDQ